MLTPFGAGARAVFAFVGLVLDIAGEFVGEVEVVV
ncbi:MAG: hypothetical protein QOF61_1687, partial [Acidobacteriota bacterium]|nr:hypothetical protein [Acidobacteriota bacterium]